jgi:hypothetical protein
VELLELGLVVLVLAVLARLAGRWSLSTIPLYLLAGLAFGEGGVLPLVTTQAFVRTGAELGLILLLFMLGLEYGASELRATVRSSWRSGLVDLLLDFPPGFLAGLALGWGPVAAAFLGGVTYVSSSGIAAKLLHDLGRMGSAETPVVLSILVVEDLAMALFLPVLAVLLAGGVTLGGVATAIGALAGVVVFLRVAARVEVGISRAVFSRSDEALLLSILGFALVVAGIAQLGSASAGVGALLAGIAISGPAARAARGLLAPFATSSPRSSSPSSGSGSTRHGCHGSSPPPWRSPWSRAPPSSWPDGGAPGWPASGGAGASGPGPRSWPGGSSRSPSPGSPRPAAWVPTSRRSRWRTSSCSRSRGRSSRACSTPRPGTPSRCPRRRSPGASRRDTATAPDSPPILAQAPRKRPGR